MVVLYADLGHRGGMSKIQAVLFDFDGTMMDTEWVIYEEVQRIFHDEGQELPLEEYAKCIGSSYEAWSPQTYLEELTGKTYDWETLRAARNKRIRARMAEQPLFPGVIQALEAVQSAGLRLAVVSSSSHEWVDGWLEHHGITHYFEHVVCRGDAPAIKPAPDLFLKGADLLALPPEACLVVEDSVNGLTAAHTAGMPVVAVPNRITTVCDFSPAEAQLESLRQFPAQLAQFL